MGEKDVRWIYLSLGLPFSFHTEGEEINAPKAIGSLIPRGEGDF